MCLVLIPSDVYVRGCLSWPDTKRRCGAEKVIYIHSTYITRCISIYLSVGGHRGQLCRADWRGRFSLAVRSCICVRRRVYPLRVGLYKILFHFAAFMWESILLFLPPPACTPRIIAIPLHVYCARYDAPSTPRLYDIHHTILAIIISCKVQVTVDAGDSRYGSYRKLPRPPTVLDRAQPRAYMLNMRSEEYNTVFYSYSACFMNILTLNVYGFLSHLG